LYTRNHFLYGLQLPQCAAFRFGFNVDWRKVPPFVNLDAMTGKKEESDISVLGTRDELVKCTVELSNSEVFFFRDIKPQSLKRRSDIVCVVRRIRKRRELILRVTNYKRHSLISNRGLPGGTK